MTRLRAAAWDTADLPVPCPERSRRDADPLVYTQAEWQALEPQGRFRQTPRREEVGVWGHQYERKA